MRFALPLLACFTVLFSSCKKEDQSEIDREIILKYIADNNLNAQSTSSGLYYVIEKEGSGEHPTLNSEVKVTYTGYLTDGTKFDESSAEGTWFYLSQLIKGWQEGIPLLKEGGEGKFIIPSELGYGSQATGKIPANSVLVFDIGLQDIR